MTDIDLKMLLQKLKRLVSNENENFISSNRFIQAKIPEIQLLYEELGYLIASYFNDMTTGEDELEDSGNWKRRLMDVAQEAEDIVDMFISSAILKNIRNKMTNKKQDRANVVDCSLNLKDVMDDIQNIRNKMTNKKWKFQKESLVNNSITLHHAKKRMIDFKLEDRSTTNGTSSTRDTTAVNPSAIEREELIVGFDEDALLIMDRLTGDRKPLDIISIVGMGGIGKTTLAAKIFNDEYAKYYFHVRGWITVSQTYETRDLLIGILMSIGKSVHETIAEQKLCEMLYKSLKGRKYLIVIDDIWNAKAWDDLRKYFPNDNTGSRVLLTTRLTEVACHASAGGFTHHLLYLSEEKSWELLRRKTFREHECPESLIETGKHIAKKCQGLPLALVVIAGLLEKEEKSKDLWEKVSESVSSYIVNDPKGCLDILALSYDHLPRHLRNCFLYVGGFPEDYKIQVQRLIRLWMAEGFIKEAGKRSLEEQGEDYLMDLVDRSLLVVASRRSDGGIKSCHLHDLLRELCLKKATEEDFFVKIGMSDRNPSSATTSNIKKQRRLFADFDVLYDIYERNSVTFLWTVLCFHSYIPLGDITRWVPSFLLLRVLDLLNIRMFNFSEIRLLVHLRYLAVWSRHHESIGYPLSEANLWSLQTLIIKGKFQSLTCSPDKMANMVNLRHLRCDRISIGNISTLEHFPIVHFNVPTLFNLQTISRLMLDDRAQILLQSCPNIKKLGCSISSTSKNQFALLTQLEALNMENYMYEPLTVMNPIRFPDTLKKLTLKGLRFPWIYMSTIQRIPKLEVLKLLDSSFEGHLWDTGDEQFCQLKFLKLQKLNIRFWEVSSINFPHLRKLVVRSCEDLKKVPLELGNISTLEHIQIDHSNSSILESVNRIQEAQRAMGNNDIHVNFTDVDPSDVFFDGDPFYE